MSFGQKKHTDAIMRERYAEMKARDGPSEDGRPMSTTIGLPKGAPQVEQRAPTSSSLVGNTMNIVRGRTPTARRPRAPSSASRAASRGALLFLLQLPAHAVFRVAPPADFSAAGLQVEWGTGDPQPPLIKPPVQQLQQKDRFEQFAAPREEATSLQQMVTNVRKEGGGFYTGACTHY